jgi:1,2-dihydroxy-3-keto-5-methylthiopentene dioxygenase
MKSIFIFCVAAASLFATEKLRIYDEAYSESPLLESSAYSQIVEQLRAIGVRFEKWDTSRPISSDPKEEEFFEAYAQDIARLKDENGYTTVDIVRMFPDSPKKIELRNKFLNEHTHTEDEVRLFVEGSGLFYLHTEGRVYIVLCQQGDLISIPANYTHWFDMGEAPHFTALRFFIDPSGWVANFTQSQISEKFPRFD